MRDRAVAAFASLLLTVGCLAPEAASDAVVDGQPRDATDVADGALTLPANLKHLGYFQAERVPELDAVATHTTLTLVGELSEPHLARARHHRHRVFVSLTGVFFDWDTQAGFWRFTSHANAQARWEQTVPLLRSYADIIEAFVPIDEPEFASFKPVMSEPNPCRDGLEVIARTVRGSFPGAKLAVNFWGSTVYMMQRDRSKLSRYYPPSYDYVGTESYDRSFDTTLYQTLASLSASQRTPAAQLYLVPKAFLSDLFPQPGGEQELITRHLEPALAYAAREPRVFAVMPFLYRTIGERGSTLRGVNELPLVRAWIEERGRALKGQPNPGPNPTPPNPTPPPNPQPPPSSDPVPAQQALPDSRVRTFTSAQAGVIVTRLYRTIFGREPDAGGLQHHRVIVEGGRLPAAVSGMMGSAEFAGRRPRLAALSWARDFYVLLLDRQAEPGAAEGVADLIRRGQAAQAVVNIILSREYAEKNLGATPPPAPTPAPPQPPAPGGSRSPIGWLDGVQSGVASGWACDQDAPTTTIDVHLYVGGPAGSGAPAFATRASRSSEPAVGAACGGGTAHRYSFAIPGWGSYVGRPVYAYGIDATGNANALLSGAPKTLR